MNNQYRHTLLEESTKEEGLSSSPHTTQVLCDEIRPFPPQTEFIIPDRYMADTLVLMPVNLETVFVYWEITPNLFSKYPAMNHHLKTKIVSIEEEKELAEFSVNGDLGNYYLHIDAAMRHIQARMGFYDSDHMFVVVMSSNVFSMPNDRIEFSDNELWMNIDEHTREILLSSLYHDNQYPYSSSSIIQEKIHEYFRVSLLSSTDLIQREK